MSSSLAPGSTSNAAGSPVTRTKKKMVSDSSNSDSKRIAEPPGDELPHEKALYALFSVISSYGAV